MALIINPATKHTNDTEYKNSFKIFLAGSIDMGTAPNWQAFVVDQLRQTEGICIMNPRMDNWTPNILQEGTLATQVDWELQHIEDADLVIFNFCEYTASPVSLMELGLCCALKPTKTICHCASAFSRAENVGLTCKRYKVPLTESLESLITTTRLRISMNKTNQ